MHRDAKGCFSFQPSPERYGNIRNPRKEFGLELHQPMSALRKMPNEKTMRVLRYSTWFFLIAVVGGLAYLRFFVQPDALHSRYTLKGLLIIGIILAFAINYFFTKDQRCPDCRRSMQEVQKDVHPKAEDYHLLYCSDCDTIWDTTIPKAKG